jgi:hypothetical protein
LQRAPIKIRRVKSVAERYAASGCLLGWASMKASSFMHSANIAMTAGYGARSHW